MNRTHLACAVQTLAVGLGYAFFALPDDDLTGGVNTWPAAVLAPLTLHAAEGRRHGRLTYTLTLRLLCPGLRLPPDERNAALARLEADLLQILAGLADDPKVIAVEETAIRPAAFTLTPHGELSQTATARVLTFF